MKKTTRTSKSKRSGDVFEYNKIMSTKTAIVIPQEWQRQGDAFQKLSFYDYTYSPVKTSGDTTLTTDL